MADDATVTIRKNFPRPTAAEIERFHGLPSGWVVDANGRRGAIDHRIRPMTPVTPFVGVALTVATAPNDNLLAYAGVSIAQPGDVLFIGTEDFEGAAVIGDIFGGFAKNKGLSAVITDGLIRDLDGLEVLDLPFFARGVSPNSPQKKGLGEIGTGVSLGGVRIESGDIVVGDRDGVVVVPRGEISNVLTAVDAIRTKEKGMEEAIAGGATEPPWLHELLDRAGTRYID